MFNRRQISSLLAAACATMACPVHAQTVIDKPLKIVVGFPAGGAADAVARLLAEQLRGSYAPSVLVDNKAGAGGRLGAQAVKAGDAVRGGKACGQGVGQAGAHHVVTFHQDVGLG